MASPHAAGALALLASNPAVYGNRTGATKVYYLYEVIKTSGNSNWTDDSGDGVKEPLLDVSTFVPALIPGGSGNTSPSVTITSPADGATFNSGATISFSGSALDAEDGNLTTSLAWTSSIDGAMGTGGSIIAGLRRRHAHHHRIGNRFWRLSWQRQHYHHH